MGDAHNTETVKLQLPACDRCSQGVMDRDRGGRNGNDHLYGRCRCECHA